MAAFLDANPDARLLCIRDHAGNLLAGKVPEPDSCVLSGDFLAFATSYGYKRK